MKSLEELKAIREQLNKSQGDQVEVTVRPR